MRCERTYRIDACGCLTLSCALYGRARSRGVLWIAQRTRARGPPPPLESVYVGVNGTSFEVYRKVCPIEEMVVR